MKQFRVKVDNKSFLMVDPNNLTVSEAIRFCFGKFGKFRVKKVERVFYERQSKNFLQKDEYRTT